MLIGSPEDLVCLSSALRNDSSRERTREGELSLVCLITPIPDMIVFVSGGIMRPETVRNQESDTDTKQTQTQTQTQRDDREV